ncbi:hypothetical protein [Melittangium boletus]|uniref:Late embryogenesis abundant protein n=1 Tax=Melittangium boletus DSM 14713 TaxID=1294270 RepID=A0A250IKP2_9BACT|nr:hypothetical protein [Melittangium boletus]ATB31793.1 late embryogenesis abundant protein [Melittangium boletus DSM 14713]
MGLGGIVSGAADAAKRAAEAAARAAEAAARAAAEAAKKAAEASQQAAQKAADTAKAGVEGVGQKVSSVATEQAKDVFEGAKDVVGGVADKAQKVAGGVVDKAQEVVGGVADKAQKVAGGVVDKAQEVVGGVADKAQKVADGAVDTTKKLAGSAVGTAQTAVGGVVDKVQDLAGDAVDRLKSAADFAVNNPGVVLDKATDLAADGLDAAGRFIQNAPTLDPLAKAGQMLVGGALQTGADLVRDPVETARSVQDAVTLSSEVDSLKPGESAKVSLDGSVNGALLSAKAKGEIEVKRNKDDAGGGYTVSVSGEAGAGVAAKLGAKGAAEAGASAYGIAGAKVEFTFATAEEAKRATDTLTQASLTTAAGATNPVAGLVTNQALGDPLGDVADLKDNVSALEFKVGAEGNLSGSIGAKGLGDVLGAGAKASLNGKQETTARVEFKDGHPSKLSLKQSVDVNAQASASAGLSVPGSNGGSTSLPGGASVDGKAGVKVELEQSFNLPKDFDPASLVNDPAGAARQINATAQETQEVKLTVTDSRQGSLKGLGFNGSAGQEVKVELTAKPEDIARSGAVDSLLEGDIGKAMTQAGSTLKTKATLQEKTTEGNNVGVGVNAGAGGGEVGLTTERTHLGQTQELSPEQLATHYLQGGWTSDLFA